MELVAKLPWKSVFHFLSSPILIQNDANKIGTIAWIPVLTEKLKSAGIDAPIEFLTEFYASRVLHLNPTEHPLLTAALYAYLEEYIMAYFKGDINTKHVLEHSSPELLDSLATFLSESLKSNYPKQSLLNKLFTTNKDLIDKISSDLNSQFLRKLPEKTLDSFTSLANDISKTRDLNRFRKPNESLLQSEYKSFCYFAEMVKCHAEIYVISSGRLIKWTFFPSKSIGRDSADIFFRIKLIWTAESEAYILYNKSECDLYSVKTIIQVEKDVAERKAANNEADNSAL